jgi:hypothetical protein
MMLHLVVWLKFTDISKARATTNRLNRTTSQKTAIFILTTVRA